MYKCFDVGLVPFAPVSFLPFWNLRSPQSCHAINQPSERESALWTTYWSESTSSS